MFRTARLTKLVAFSALLLVPATVVGFWALSTGPSLAGDRDAPMAFSVSGLGSKVFLGVETEEETGYSEGGARITGVVDDSAADDAGLEKGDIIVEFDGRTIRGPRGLVKQIRSLDPGDEVSITVVRDGRERTLEVVLGERPGLFGYAVGEGSRAILAPGIDCDRDDDCSFSWSCSGDDCQSFSFDFGGFGQGPMLGVQIVHVTAELREHLGGEEGSGVLVSRIVPGSPAELGGIEVGDLIVAVDGDTVEDVGDIRKALRDKEGETFGVEVIRDGRSTTIDVSLPERDDEPPTGPRAFHLELEPRIELRLDDLEHALESVHGVADQYRHVLREAQRARGDAMKQIRHAYRDAAKPPMRRSVRRSGASTIAGT